MQPEATLSAHDISASGNAVTENTNIDGIKAFTSWQAEEMEASELLRMRHTLFLHDVYLAKITVNQFHLAWLMIFMVLWDWWIYASWALLRFFALLFHTELEWPSHCFPVGWDVICIENQAGVSHVWIDCYWERLRGRTSCWEVPCPPFEEETESGA